MKKFLPLLILTIISCQTKQDFVLAPVDFANKIKETPDAIVLDVRRVDELPAGVIEHSINIVYDPSFDTKLADLPKKPIFIYCASGIRSAKAAKILREKGYGPVYELQGGFNQWLDSNMPAAVVGQ